MQCEETREILSPKPLKKYSIDLSIFSSSERHNDFDSDLGARDHRRMLSAPLGPRTPSRRTPPSRNSTNRACWPTSTSITFSDLYIAPNLNYLPFIYYSFPWRKDRANRHPRHPLKSIPIQHNTRNGSITFLQQKTGKPRHLQSKIHNTMRSGANQNVDYILLNLMPQQSAAPCFQKAITFREQYSAYRGDSLEPAIKQAFGFKTEEFKKYGSGVYLYFYLIKMLFCTFLLISLNSLPILLSNFKGDGLNIYGQSSFAKSLMRVSLANQRHVEVNAFMSNDSMKTDLLVSQSLVIAVDIINSLIFLVFLVFWRAKSDSIVHELLSQDALPSYYTLQVANLPPHYSQQSIVKHFEKFKVRVAQVSTVYNYENVLQEVNTLIHMVDNYAAQSEPARKSLYTQIKQQLNKVRNLVKRKKPQPVFCLVTFEDMQMRNFVKDMYKFEIKPKDLPYNGTTPKVSSCRVQPASIIWQNYHLQTTTQLRQSILIGVLVAAFLLATLVALFLVNARGTSIRQKQQSFAKQFDYSRSYSYSEAKSLASVEAVFVFCSQVNYHEFTLEIYRFCEPYLSSYRQRFESMISISLLVVLINMVLNRAISWLANYRRYRTKTEKSSFLILNIFALSFINSGLLMLLIRVDLAGYSLGRVIAGVISLPADQFSLEAYADFNRKWYLNVGSQIVMIHGVSLLVSPFLQITVNWLLFRYREFIARRQKTQLKMNEAMGESEFDYESFYANILNACFFTMFHGNAFPLLYIIAVAAFFCMFAASYIVFYYFSCKPVMLDHAISSLVSKVMCLSLVFHQLTSILYFYTEDIFPLDFDHSADASRHTQGDVLLHKLHQSLPFIVLTIVFIFFTFQYKRVCAILAKHFRAFLGQGQSRSKQNKKFSQILDKSHQKQSETLNQQQPTKQPCYHGYLYSYRMQDNPFYSDFCYAIRILGALEPYFSEQELQGEVEREEIGSVEHMEDECLSQKQSERALRRWARGRNC